MGGKGSGRKPSWTPEEDALLVKLIEEGKAWHEIAEQFAGRNPRTRWAVIKDRYPDVHYQHK